MKRLLLVEDDPDYLALVRRALRKAGLNYQMDAVEDGLQALDYLWRRGGFSDRSAESLPRVVLLDINLPSLSGLEVLRRLRDEPRTRRLPVVLFSSSREHSDRAAGYDLGANSYLCKPADFRQLVSLVRQVSEYWLELNECPPK